MERDHPRWAMLRHGWWLPCIALLACSGEAVDVRVAVDPELRSAVEVVSVDSMRPGDPNAVDVRIELAARTDRPVRAWFAADWSDDRGNGYGGQSGQVHAAPGAAALLHLGTMSAAASRLELRISDTPPPGLADVPAKPRPTEPDAADIPRWVNRFVRTPLAGMVAGKAFEARTVVFVHDQRFDRWRVEAWDQPLRQLWDLGLVDATRRRVILELEAAPRPAATTSRLLQGGGGHIELPAREPAVRSAANAWVLVTERWEVGGWSASGDPNVQRVGRASGRLNVCFAASRGLAQSCIAGSFADAPIVAVRDAR